MKKTIITILAVAAASVASAQYYDNEVNPGIKHIQKPKTLQRTEFHAPTIDGYTAYKADLHTHSIFSDGHLSMEARVREAWSDGLDVIAITEHLEYRPHEKNLVKYLNGYMKKGTEASAYSFVEKNHPKKGEINVDLNAPVEFARKAAEIYNMTIISGIEVTRRPGGLFTHLNALFTKDNNTIYDPDPLQSLRNAKAQGALIMHNHPGWLRKNMEMTEFDKAAYKEGLIDGIEVMNGIEFYPSAITRAAKYNLFMSANTDCHYPTSESYSSYGARRNMTLIYAKDKSEASLREAIEAHRTICYSYGTLVGSEDMLRKFFEASVTIQKNYVDYKGRIQVQLTNTSSVDWHLYPAGAKRSIELHANSSIIVRIDPKNPTTFIVKNAWYGEDKNLTYCFKLD